MAHFAKIEDSTVTKVIVISNDDCGSEYPVSELVGQRFIADLKLSGQWVQTSYNNNFRNKLAGIGNTFEADMFIAPQPYPSWTLINGEWAAPVSNPYNKARWDEATLSWIEV